MKNEITRYKNEMNTIPMRNWTAEEMDFFFAVLTQMRDKGTKLMFFDKKDLAKLAKFSVTANKRYHDVIESLIDKVGSLKYFSKTENRITYMPLFTYFDAKWTDDLSDMTLEVEVNERFEYILNQWKLGEWTQFVLDEFLDIRSTYSKTLFRLLKQWRTVGKKEFSLEEFKSLMTIPKSYPTGMITQRIVHKGLEDLQPYFKNLKVKTVKSNTRGNPVSAYLFTWDPEKTEPWQQNKYYEAMKEIRENPEDFEPVPMFDWVNSGKETEK